MKISDYGKKLIIRFLPSVSGFPRGLSEMAERIDEAKRLTARLIINQIKERGDLENIREAEFKVFSQFGDDGIIQYLIHRIGISPERGTFVEFGVADYVESNTRFLLVNNNWKGLVMDSNPDNIATIIKSDLYWKHDLTAVSAFVSRESLDELLCRHGFDGDLGLLHIDIDGNDYWVWEGLHTVKPAIVIMEYNSVFGSDRAVTIPYDPSFQRTKAHHSNLYWGCSLKALCLLAEEKGYNFIGTNSNGNNAYFVRRDKTENLRTIEAGTGYIASRFRESRDEKGRLTYLSGTARIQPIADMPLYDLEREILIKVGDLTSNTNSG